MELIKTEDELYDITGGISLSSSVINALVSGARIILEIGRSLGSALRRSTSKNMC